jgi:hypothetical protein
LVRRTRIERLKRLEEDDVDEEWNGFSDGD